MPEVLLTSAASGAALPAPVPEPVEKPVWEPHQTSPKNGESSCQLCYLTTEEEKIGRRKR